MQEKRRNISPVKDRILYYIENLSISKREFYSKTGISRGTLESPTGITEDTLAKFIATYPEVSLEWLIRGEGEIVRPNGPEGSGRPAGNGPSRDRSQRRNHRIAEKQD